MGAFQVAMLVNTTTWSEAGESGFEADCIASLNLVYYHAAVHLELIR